MAIPILLAANNATSTLASAISTTSLTCTVASGEGALFPQPATNEYFKLTFIDAATGNANEIVHVTAVSGDTLTITRAQEGTVAQAWRAEDKAENLFTAGAQDALTQQAEVQLNQFNFATTAGSANALTCYTDPVVTPPVDGLAIVFKAAYTNTAAVTLAFNGLAAAPLRNQAGAALTGGELVANGMVHAEWNSTNAAWIIITSQGGNVKNLGLGTAATKNVGTSAGQIPDISAFAALNSGNGYQKLPSGMIIQWCVGTTAVNDTTGLLTLTWPIAFNSVILGGIANEAAPGGWSATTVTVWAFDPASTLTQGKARMRNIVNQNGPAITGGISGRIFAWGY